MMGLSIQASPLMNCLLQALDALVWRAWGSAAKSKGSEACGILEGAPSRSLYPHLLAGLPPQLPDGGLEELTTYPDLSRWPARHLLVGALGLEGNAYQGCTA